MLIIRRLELRGKENVETTITNVKHVSSYSWIEAESPTIAVPGIPPRWNPPATATKLAKDSGLIYIAQNGARHPDSPLEPLFRAIYTTHPTYDVHPIDVVSDRNNLRKLLSFIDPSTTRDGHEAFAINLEVHGSTVVFCRTETETVRLIGPNEFRGYGHEFERAYTDCAISDSTGHHRIVSYRLGDLKMLVRYEVDAYATDNADHKSARKDNQPAPKNADVANLLDTLSLSKSKTSPLPNEETGRPAGSKLTIRRQGQEVPDADVLEIKTRVAHKAINDLEVMPQLWISQTPKLVRAYHYYGDFQEPRVENVMQGIKAWERDNQTSLQKLVVLLKHIVHIAQKLGGNMVLRHDGMGQLLTIAEAEMESMLPKDLHVHWESFDSKK